MNELLKHAKSLIPEVNLDRRGFLAVSAAASGYALATGPASAQTIKTDTVGLVAGMGMVPAKGQDIPAYYAYPAKGGPFPTILVVSEIFGVHEYIKDVCRRLAKLGYFAVAPELFVRQGDVANMKDIKDVMATIAKVPDPQVMSDLDDTVKWVATSGKADVKRLGITGFCRGGRYSWLYTEHNPAVKAAVAWYGPVAGTKTDLSPAPILDNLGKINAAVLGLYGGADQGIPVDTLETLKAGLRAAGKTNFEIVVYPDTPHAFHADYRPSYRETQAKDGWGRMKAWFAKYL